MKYMKHINGLYVPDRYAAGFEQITYQNLAYAGLGDTKLVLTDVDGVLRNYHDPYIPPSKKRTIESLGKRGIAVGTFTNASSERIEALKADGMLGDVIPPDLIRGSYNNPKLKKPHGEGLVQFFELEYDHIVYTGDQIFADVAAANNAKALLQRLDEDYEPTPEDPSIKSILLAMYGEHDNFWVKAFRRGREARLKDAMGIPRTAAEIPPGIHRSPYSR